MTACPDVASTLIGALAVGLISNLMTDVVKKFWKTRRERIKAFKKALRGDV
jgi:hypothetical protein